MATPQHDACTVEGQVKDVLLNGDTENYSGEQGYTTHTITRDHSKGITVQLNQPYIVNCIRMLLWDRDNRWVSSEELRCSFGVSSAMPRTYL